MAELVDALVSGASFREEVQVRFLFWAQNISGMSTHTANVFIQHRERTVGSNRRRSESRVELALTLPSDKEEGKRSHSCSGYKR